MNASSLSASRLQFGIVGVPDSERVKTFCNAAIAAGFRPPVVQPWSEFLPHGEIDPRATHVRLETPGRNWDTERKLLLLGAAETDEADPTGKHFERIDAPDLERLGEPVGRVYAMRQWYLGWRRALDQLLECAKARRFFNDPRSVATLFDKEKCQRQMEAGGCAMPASLGTPVNFEDLWERMRTHGKRRVFLKSCHGSSASCVVALESAGNQIQAFSTALLAGSPPVLWNTRPGKLYRELREVIAVVNAVCRQRAQAQVWVPKCGWADHRIDFRVVTVAGTPTHAVLRMSKTPLTNLQLRNQSGDFTAFAAANPEGVERVYEQARQAARCFPECLSLGIDVALSSTNRAYVLEANAFGDFLQPRHLRGTHPYDTQLAYVSANG